MPAPSGRVRIVVFLLLVACAGIARGSDTPDDQDPAIRLAAVQTYIPQQFRQSLIDYLSGEFPKQFPYRIAADPQGRIFVTDPAVSSVHVFDTLNKTRWEIHGDRHHRLTHPAYIAADSDGNVYITDLGLAGVMVYDASGLFLRTIGSSESNMPSGVWVDSANRILYVSDCWSSQVLSFDLRGNPLRVFGGPGRGPGQFNCPRDLLVHGEKLLVLDAANHRFQIFDLSGQLLGILPFGVDRSPFAFAVDSADRLYYADMYSGGLVVVDPHGKTLGELDAQRQRGQWVERPGCPNFVSLAADAKGDILALRPSLKIDLVQPVLSPHP